MKNIKIFIKKHSLLFIAAAFLLVLYIISLIFADPMTLEERVRTDQSTRETQREEERQRRKRLIEEYNQSKNIKTDMGDRKTSEN